MSVCVSVSPVCATNNELNLISSLLLCLYMKITTCLLVLINQSRAESCEFVSSLSAHDSSQREIQETGVSYMITMVQTKSLHLHSKPVYHAALNPSERDGG